ncbi:MAG: D-alanine--D-alanine ligase A [Candidatus Sungbacteria bacterium RIFCSPHIGHO2_02_FULL_47_11]|uniref:D-alanine--D-alanine ligase n=1 Tax=Candidatus Sungbacteria bacterium RIFCSPHIGHO2_02_FULL_47_11 TaxID=1802270 RepID=A0A1G2KFQ3_9BACT|nr:MAG: D-alanine--D-alanine ligase A [Candidatus Sungbacteria bacterium RIFCSPHIGHO2_02_FULL_47_11]
MRKKIRVGILFGGKSAEHEVSLQSAKNIVEALDKKKYEPILIGIDKKGRWHQASTAQFLLHSENPKLIKLNQRGESTAIVPTNTRGQLINLSRRETARSLDIVFPILHGPFGEDGTVQGLLKLMNIPFVGAGVLGSAVGMDKDVMKRLLRDAGIPTAKFLVRSKVNQKRLKPNFKQIKNSFGVPFFVKPANLGSSVGIHKVKSEKEFLPALEDAFGYDLKVLIEEYIPGREIECAVLGNENPIASVPGEIIPQHEFYSYEAKYIDENGALFEIPAKLPRVAVKKIQDMALRAFKALCCEGMARVDFFLKKDGTVILNEINTIPGFTKISMYPKLWEASGISYSKLIDSLIKLALERFEKEQRLKTSVDT